MSNPGKKDIWSAILEDKKKRESGDSTDKDGGKIESKTNSEDKHESYILVVGSKGSGKTTHIAHFLSSGGGPENPKSTTALEYKYGRRVVSTKKQLVNVWELGGGTSLKDLSNIPLIPQRLPTAAVCIVLNLEKPGSIINSLAFWLQVVRERASTVFADIEKNKPQVAEELRQKIQRPYVNNVDMKAGLLDLSYVPMVVVLTHHDEFVKEDPVKRKVLLQAVRFMCHTFGASLICGGNPTTKNPSILHFRSILNRHAFRVDTKMSKQVEISKPCIVHAGQDSIEEIGLPPGMTMEMFSAVAIDKRVGRWHQVCAEYFPITSDGSEVAESKAAEFVEPSVDAAYAQKMAELREEVKQAEAKEKALRQNRAQNRQNRAQRKKRRPQ